jgi:Family of unknown function (DUF5681)
MDDRDKPDYSVGYKKPPRHAQFKPGESGNRNGRPKKSTTFADVLTKQLRKKVAVTLGGNKTKKIHILEAIAMKHLSKAANGDPKSTEIVLECLKSEGTNQNGNLGELLHQFRSIHASREANNRVPGRSTDAGSRKRNRKPPKTDSHHSNKDSDHEA